jgi:Ribbon-helix-helix protein, copG family
VLESIERLLARDRGFVLLACLIVDDLDRDGVGFGVPAKTDVEAAVLPAHQLMELGLRHVHPNGGSNVDIPAMAQTDVWYMYGGFAMVKTTVYLPEELKKRVEETARLERKSEAEVIRAAVREYTQQRARPRPTFPVFASGDPSLAERVDELLAEGFGRD